MFLKSMFNKCRLDISMKFGRPFEAIIGDEVYFINTANEWQKVNTRTGQFFLFNYNTKCFDLIRHDCYHVDTWNNYATAKLEGGYRYVVLDYEPFIEEVIESREFIAQTMTKSHEDYEKINDAMPYEPLEFTEMTMSDDNGDAAILNDYAEEEYNKASEEIEGKLFYEGTPTRETCEWVLSGNAYKLYTKLHALSRAFNFTRAFDDLAERIKFTINTIGNLFHMEEVPVNIGGEACLFATLASCFSNPSYTTPVMPYI